MQCNELPDTHINTCTNTLPNWVVQSVDGAGGPTLSCSHCSQSGTACCSDCCFSYQFLFLLSLFVFCVLAAVGWRLQCWENFLMGSAFMWPLVCRPSCCHGYCQETRLRLGHGWQTIFIISNDTQKEIPFQASYLFQQPARTRAANKTSRNFNLPEAFLKTKIIT